MSPVKFEFLVKSDLRLWSQALRRAVWRLALSLCAIGGVPALAQTPPLDCPPAAQEKAIAEAKALQAAEER